MENEVKIFRLMTGEDIISEYHKISKDSYVLINPMNIVVKFKGKDSSVYMEHWLPVEVIKSNEIIINPSFILTSYLPNEGLEEYYRNLVDKLHLNMDKRKKLENMDLDEMLDVMEALEQSQDQTLH